MYSEGGDSPFLFRSAHVFLRVLCLVLSPTFSEKQKNQNRIQGSYQDEQMVSVP